MLGQELSGAGTCSPPHWMEGSWYNQFFHSNKDLLHRLHLSASTPPSPPLSTRSQDMKLVEGGAATMGSSSQYCLRWNNHRNNLLAAFDQLLHVEAFTDVTLACEEGVTLHAHRLVLAACSSYFQALFVNARTQHHPIVVLKDVRAGDMRALLEYMYRGEVNVEHDALQGLLRVAESLKVKGLVEELGPDGRRPPSPHESSRPPTSPLDIRPHQDLSRPRPEPPTSTAPPSLSGHDSARSSSPPAPLYTLPPPGLAPHRVPPRSDLRDPRLDPRELDLRENRDLRELREHLRDQLREPRDYEARDSQTPSSQDSEPRLPLPHLPPVPHLPSHCPDSPPHKRKRPMLGDPMLSPTPILRTALGQTHGFPGPDMSSLVSLANSMMPLPGLLGSHVPHLLPHDHRDHESPYGLGGPKKEPYDEDSRPFPDIPRDDDDHKIKHEPTMHNGPLLPEFNPYHLDPNGSSHYSNFVSYVPTPKPEWKRYKQYTKTDLMDAIDAVRNGMTALQASRKYKVPSRTLYDKIKKMGISTVPRRLPSKKPSPSSTELEVNVADPAIHHPAPPPPPPPPPSSHHHQPQPQQEPPTDAPQPEREPHTQPHSLHELEKRHLKALPGDEDDATAGMTTHHPAEDEDDPSTATPTVGSFSLVGRKMFENGAGGGGEPSAGPLDLTDTETILPKRSEIEERA